MLPTFLGIGVMRAGTTWLHELLAGHPDVYVPTHRKEVRFFNRYYERGLPWYEKFFPADEQASQYLAIGEVTPSYFYCPDCPERIASVPSITKLILILRNPVDRAHSHYRLRVRDWNYSKPFESFLSFRPNVIQQGFYSQRLQDYYRYFTRDQILVLIYERAFADISETKETLARFLGVAVDRFSPTAGVERVNRGYVPKAQSAYALAMYVARTLRYKWKLDWVVELVKRLGISRLFGEGAPLPPMKEETRQYLGELYADEIEELESLLQIDLACWKQVSGSVAGLAQGHISA